MRRRVASRPTDLTDCNLHRFPHKLERRFELAGDPRAQPAAIDHRPGPTGPLCGATDGGATVLNENCLDPACFFSSSRDRWPI